MTPEDVGGSLVDTSITWGTAYIGGKLMQWTGEKWIPLNKNEVKAGKGTNSVTQADAAKYFGQERKYWSKDPIEFNGNKVYQRNDLFDPKYVDPKSGKTNLQLMEQGRAPIGYDKKPINLHHMTQRQDGAIAEVTQSFHQQYSDKIHINPNTIPSEINRNQFNKWRSNYWKNRANDFK